MTYLQIKEIMNNLYAMGVRIFLIEGGEPLLWRDGDYTVREVIREAKKLFFSVGITTNGILPLEGIKADTVWVSLDGLKDTHNYIRGAEIFDKIIDNINRSSHPNINVNITISAVNWQEIPELVKFLADKVKGVTIQFYYPYEEDEEFVLPFEKRKIVLDNLIRLKKEGFPIANSFSALKALKNDKWTKRCTDWMIVSVEPDGQIDQGCYVKNRGVVRCDLCGFSTHTEISLAYQLKIEPILVGKKIFRYNVQ